ncbi:MAG: toprim domain-containing protein [bacterium]|nr:toprim domain-containing protein [bacterium]
MLPDPIKKFADVFSKLPGIGPRQALRLAFYLSSEERALMQEISFATDSMSRVKICSLCFYPHTNTDKLCAICESPARLKNIIAIVEKATDLMSLEKTKRFKGHYLVLGDLGKSGVMETEQKLRLETLKNYISKELGGKAEEIILAINPTAYGDLNASMLQKELAPHTNKLTRLGRGIPTGGEIEFADEETLSAAILGRI